MLRNTVSGYHALLNLNSSEFCWHFDGCYSEFWRTKSPKIIIENQYSSKNQRIKSHFAIPLSHPTPKINQKHQNPGTIPGNIPHCAGDGHLDGCDGGGLASGRHCRGGDAETIDGPSWDHCARRHKRFAFRSPDNLPQGVLLFVITKHRSDCDLWPLHVRSMVTKWCTRSSSCHH